MLGIFSGLLVTGLSIRSRQTEPKLPPGALTSKSAPPSVKPAAKTVVSYTVPSADPKYITIPAISIGNTPIIKLGLTSSGAIGAPDRLVGTTEALGRGNWGLCLSTGMSLAGRPTESSTI